MKKTILKSALAAVAGVALMSGSAMALHIPGGSLQTVLDDITVSPVAGDSSIDVTSDYLGYDEKWEITASGGSVSTMIIELASYKEGNIFGVYDGDVFVNLFEGEGVAGDQALLSIKLDGSVYVNFADTGKDFSGNNFGYFLDSRAGDPKYSDPNDPNYNPNYESHGGLWFSETELNADGEDHMFAYQGNGSDYLQLGDMAPGEWSDNEFILAFEDLHADYSDWDYTDFVVMVESVQPVPEPATMLLFGAGLAGLAGYRRKKAQK